MSVRVLLLLHNYSVTLKNYLALVLTSFSFPCPVSGNEYLYVVFQLWPITMHLYKLSIVSFTKFTIFLCIQPTVKLASVSASSCAHWLEGFAIFSIITPKSFLPQSLSIPEKTHKGRQRDLMTLLYY